MNCTLHNGCNRWTPLYLTQNTTTTILHTFWEVLASNEHELWMAAMQSEFHTLMVNNTFRENIKGLLPWAAVLANLYFTSTCTLAWKLAVVSPRSACCPNVYTSDHCLFAPPRRRWRSHLLALPVPPPSKTTLPLTSKQHSNTMP